MNKSQHERRNVLALSDVAERGNGNLGDEFYLDQCFVLHMCCINCY